MSDDDEVIDGFLYQEKDVPHDGEVVSILGRVNDPAVLEAFGPAFFIRFIGGEIGIAVAKTLSPWFPV